MDDHLISCSNQNLRITKYFFQVPTCVDSGIPRSLVIITMHNA